MNPQVRWYWDFCGNTPQHFPRQNCSPRFLHSQNSCQSPETSHSQVPSHLQQNHFIFLFFFLSLSSISTLLSHPCQLHSYCWLKLRSIYWEEKRCTIAQIQSSIDAFAISFPLSASAQPAKLSQSSLRSTSAEEETSNPTTTDWRKTGVGSFNVEKHYWLAFCHKMGCEGNMEGKFYHICQIYCKENHVSLKCSSHFLAIAVHISSAVSNISQSAQSFLCRGRGRPAWLQGMWDSHCLSSPYLSSRFLCICSVVKHWPRS